MLNDPVLLQGREGRWTWPWVLVGTLAALVVVLAPISGSLEGFAEERQWIAKGILDLTLDPEQPFTFAIVTIAALPLLLCPLLLLQFLHRVPWRRAFAYRGSFDWPLFARSALALLLVFILVNLLAAASAPDEFRLQPRGLGHVPWALLGMIAVFAGALGEDVLFKGYLFRVWGALVPARWPVVAVVVVVFTALHVGNTDLGEDRAFSLFYFALTEVVWFFAFLRTQNLAAPAGLHWMNNVWDTLFVAKAPGQATTLALVVQTDPAGGAEGSRLLDPLAHVSEALPLALLLALLLWPRSPFYLKEASAGPAGPAFDARQRP
jgi:membrane protease YdiL (CAAX protease family)